MHLYTYWLFLVEFSEILHSLKNSFLKKQITSFILQAWYTFCSESLYISNSAGFTSELIDEAPAIEVASFVSTSQRLALLCVLVCKDKHSCAAMVFYSGIIFFISLLQE